MRFGLRTLLLVTAIAPLLVGGGIRAYWAYEEYLKERQQAQMSAFFSERLQAAMKQNESDPSEAEDNCKVLLHQVEWSRSIFDVQIRSTHVTAICDAIRKARKQREDNDTQSYMERGCYCYPNNPSPAPPSWLSIISDDCFPSDNP